MDNAEEIRSNFGADAAQSIADISIATTYSVVGTNPDMNRMFQSGSDTVDTLYFYSINDPL